MAIVLDLEDEDAYDSETEDPTLVLNRNRMWCNDYSKDDMITVFVPENDGDEFEGHLSYSFPTIA